MVLLLSFTDLPFTGQKSRDLLAATLPTDHLRSDAGRLKKVEFNHQPNGP